MIYPFGDHKALCFSSFGRVERVKSHRKVQGRNNYEQITKNRFQIRIDNSKTGQYTVMPYIFVFLCVCNSFCVIVYVLTYVYECFKEIEP